MTRTERESEKRQTCWCCRDQWRACRINRRAALDKRKRAICPDCKGGESQNKRQPTLEKKGGSERKHGEETMDSTVKKGRFQGEGQQEKRTSLEESTSG